MKTSLLALAFGFISGALLSYNLTAQHYEAKARDLLEATDKAEKIRADKAKEITDELYEKYKEALSIEPVTVERVVTKRLYIKSDCDGTQERGRDVAEVGAHVAGHNANSIGICLVGGKGGFNFTMRQMDSLKELLLRLIGDYPGAEILGHTDLDSRKTCPNFDVKEWWQG